MKLITEFPKEKAEKLEFLLCDIDDTITTDGKLTAEAYASLWALNNAGIGVIPVTGRPAGWCDLIVRQWPVKAVIGENGAFVYYMENGQLKTFTHPSVVTDVKERLKEIESKVLKKIPGTRVAKDQFSRIYDLAIDFAEDPPRLSLETAEEIRKICAAMGAQAKVSSIHVNTWFGDYDKVCMARLFLREIMGVDDLMDKVFYFGDSPNDEPMFGYFKNSCGVANIKPFLSSLEHPPAYITQQPSGEGFTYGVDHILKLYR